MAISTIPLPIRPPNSSSTSSSSSLLTPTPTTPIRHHPHHHYYHHHQQPTYIRSGIGGAGNWHKASSIPPPPPPQSPATTHHQQRPHVGGGGPLAHDNNSAPLLLQTPSSSSSCTHFKSGIGGAGNTHPLTARSVLGFDEEVARCRAVERRLPVAYHVGIGGAGNFRARSDGGGGGGKRLRPQTSAGALGVKRSEGDLRIEAGADRASAAPRAMVGVVGRGGGGAVKRVSWGEHSVDEFEVDGYEGDGEMEAERECVYYSNEPLPYGALDVLRRRLERAFASRSGGVGDGREVLASPKDKRRGAVLVGSEGERRGLRSHRSMWRF